MPKNESTRPGPAEMELIERFIGAFNAIDLFLEEALGASPNQSFRSLVDLYARRNKWWKDADWLRLYTNLRNIIVHDKVSAFEYPCIPTLATVERVERIRDELLHPEPLLPRFQKQVAVFAMHDTMSYVLRVMHQENFSHFPVYGEKDGKHSCLGLLTENGIARWLAEMVCNKINLVNLDKESVREVLGREEPRQNFHFAPPHASVRQILHQFYDNPYLEAVLITPHGNPHALPQGIITRRDVMIYHG